MLVAGGPDAELYSGRWTAAGALQVPRNDHAAVALAGGGVLVVGGTGPLVTGDGAETWDGAGWTLTGPVVALRTRPAIARLRDGRVLVAGGGALASAELYHPATRTWTPAGTMHAAHADGAATLLPDGRVLVAGGATRGTDIFDPATGAWSRGPDLNVARSTTALLTLADGRVLALGDVTSELLHGGAWLLAAPLNENRTGHAALLLADNSALVVGGRHAASAERFVASPLAPPPDTPIPPSPGVVKPEPGPHSGPPIGARGSLRFAGKLPERVDGGQLTVKLRCAGGACGDTLTLKRGKQRLASRDFSVRDGGTVTVRLTLRRKLPKRATAVTFALTRQKLAVSGKLRR